MERGVVLAAIHPAHRALVGQLPVAGVGDDGEFVLEGGHRIAAAALLFLTGLMFTIPPTVALPVLAGNVR
jgi:hypothetical protein